MLIELQSVPARSRVSGGLIALVVLTALTAIYACLRMFTGFTPYDDEGSLMLMSRWLLDGHAVYREFSSIYGPFYFLYAWIGHTLIGGEASHTASRLFAVGPWVLTCMLGFGYTLRVTGSRAAALAVWLALLRTLAFFAAEPGHPQEISVLLVVALIAAAARSKPGHMAISGALVAALILTKINLGVFASAALLLVAASAHPAGRTRNILVAFTGGCCIAAPAVLMLQLLGTPWVQDCCVLLTLSILAMVLIVVNQESHVTFSRTHWFALTAGFVACASLVLAWSVTQGSSLAAMVQSVFWNNLAQAHTWTTALRAGGFGILTGTAGAVVAVVSLGGTRSRAFEWLRLTIGTVALLLILAGQAHLAFALALPFVWLVMVPAGSPKRQWARRILAAVTVMQAMNVYPVAGSQLRFALVPLSIAATQMIYDAWTALELRPVEHLAIALVLAGYCIAAVHAIVTYLSFTPLGLNGTSGIRIDPGDQATYRWVVTHARQSCDSLVSFPAMHSFYFWTGMLPPVYPDVDGWQAYTNKDRQDIEQKILASPRACVLVVDELLPFWLPAGAPMKPTLLPFIRKNFIETDNRNGFHFLVRKH